jgi:hypothetical protein
MSYYRTFSIDDRSAGIARIQSLSAGGTTVIEVLLEKIPGTRSDEKPRRNSKPKPIEFGFAKWGSATSWKDYRVKLFTNRDEAIELCRKGDARFIRIAKQNAGVIDPDKPTTESNSYELVDRAIKLLSGGMQ